MHTLCSINDIPEGSSKGFIVKKLNLFVVHKDDQFYAYINSCPHRGIPLEWQEDQFLDYEGNLIQCATHGALFLIDSGDCVSGPCTGQSLIKLDCQVISDQVMVDIDYLISKK